VWANPQASVRHAFTARFARGLFTGLADIPTYFDRLWAMGKGRNGKPEGDSSVALPPQNDSALRRFILSEARNQKPVGKGDMRGRKPTPMAFCRPLSP
jgi:hypothetical protein